MNRLFVAAASAAACFFCAIGLACAAVDANTASRAELESISGIGPATSARIVEERRSQPFRDPQDLVRRVKGIGETRMRRMVAAGLTVGGSAVLVSSGGKAAPAQRLGAVLELQPAPPTPACAGGERPPLRADATGARPRRGGKAGGSADERRAR